MQSDKYLENKKEIKLKRTNQSVAFLFTALIGAVTCIAGCSSTGIQRSEKATTTMQTIDNDIKLIVVQLDATGASLDELTRPGQSDVKKAFVSCTDHISKIEKMEKAFAIHADEMKDRGKNYFDEWQKEDNKYNNAQIRELSEQRRAQLGEIYGKIAENSVEVKGPFKAYVSDVKEIQIYVSNDLTSKGIESIAPITRKAVDDGEKLKSAIRNLQAAIAKARAEMSHAGM
jgi:outer membrane murein-binding lipoprotein Lpp